MAQKLSKPELKHLQELVQKTNNINNRRAGLCLEKELALRQIEKNFKEQWDLMELNLEHSQRDQQNYVMELSLKYGKGHSFDIDTGEIKTVPNE